MAFDNLKGKMGVALYSLCMFITFTFLVTSAPISQFKGKGMFNGGAKKTSCVTVWGLKNDCSHNDYDYRLNFACSKPKQLFQATEAFYIISVVISLLCMVFSGLFFVGVPMKAALITLGAANIAFALIPWAIMTAVWYQSYCDNDGIMGNLTTGEFNGIPTGKLLRDNYKTSAGYGLTIAGWCVNIIGFIVLLAVTA